jgi:hypothetical protein
MLDMTLDPEWQAQIVAGQLKTVGQAPATSQRGLVASWSYFEAICVLKLKRVLAL